MSLTNSLTEQKQKEAEAAAEAARKASDKEGIQKAAEEAKILQAQLLDEGDKEVIKKFGDAGVKVDAVPPAELAKIQEKVKPVVAKFAPQIGEEFIKGFYAEIEKARAAN